MSKTTEANQKLFNGNKESNKKNYEGAAKSYQEAVELYKGAINNGDDSNATQENLGKAYLNLTAVLINNKSFTDAIKVAETAIADKYPLEEILSVSYYNLSLEQIGDKKFEEAIGSLIKARESNPEDQEIQKTLLYTYCKLIEHFNVQNFDTKELLDDAMKVFDKVKVEDQKDLCGEYGISIYSHMGARLLKEQQYKDAAALLKKAETLFADKVKLALEDLALAEYATDPKEGITMLLSLLYAGDEAVKDNLNTICVSSNKPDLYEEILLSGVDNPIDVDEFGV